MGRVALRTRLYLGSDGGSVGKESYLIACVSVFLLPSSEGLTVLVMV